MESDSILFPVGKGDVGSQHAKIQSIRFFTKTKTSKSQKMLTVINNFGSRNLFLLIT